MQVELEEKWGTLQEIINKNLEMTRLLLNSQEKAEDILISSAQNVMTNTCDIAKMYKSQITDLSVDFLMGTEDLEAAITLSSTSRAQDALATLEKQVNKLLDGGKVLSTTFENASLEFYPEIYTAETNVKKDLKECVDMGIKNFAQKVMDENVTVLSMLPELKALGKEIAQMSYQHKVNIEVLHSQMSGDALKGCVCPLLAQARSSKAQLALSQCLVRQSLRLYKACVGPHVSGNLPAVPLSGAPSMAAFKADKEKYEPQSLLNSSAALFGDSNKTSVSGKGIKSSQRMPTDAKDKVTCDLSKELGTPSKSKQNKPGTTPSKQKHNKHGTWKKAKRPKKSHDDFSTPSDSDNPVDLVDVVMSNGQKQHQCKQKRSYASPGSIKKTRKRPRPDISSSSGEADEDVPVNNIDSKFDKGSLKWRHEHQWKLAFEYTQLDRISQGILIDKLLPEPNRSDQSLFLVKRIQAGWMTPRHP